jgi:hypothetical protein
LEQNRKTSKKSKNFIANKFVVLEIIRNFF